MLGRRSMLVAITLVACPALAQAYECPISRGDAAPGGTSYQQITARSGQACSVPINSTAGRILGLRIVRQASHGTATTPALDEYDYRPRAGYVGDDRFSVVLASPRGPVKFDVSVRVEP